MYSQFQESLINYTYQYLDLKEAIFVIKTR